jgi:hypothetical protein
MRRNVVSVFTKRAVAITLAMLVVLGASLGVTCAVQTYTRHLQELAQKEADHKLAWKKANIRALIEMSNVQEFSSDEQDRIDHAGDDMYKIHQVIFAIVQERQNYWYTRVVKLNGAIHELRQSSTNIATLGIRDENEKNAEALANGYRVKDEMSKTLWAFTEAKDKLEKWQPSALDTFKEEIPFDTPTTTSSPKPIARTDAVRPPQPSGDPAADNQGEPYTPVFSDSQIDVQSLAKKPYYNGCILTARIHNKTNTVMNTVIMHVNGFDSSGTLTENATFVFHDVPALGAVAKDMTGSLQTMPATIKIVDVSYL